MSAMSILLVLVSSFRGKQGGGVGRLAAARFVFRRRGRFGRGQVAAPARDDLDARSFAARRHADGLLLLAALFLAGRALLIGALALNLLAEDAGVRDPAREQLQRTDRVVVAG